MFHEKPGEPRTAHSATETTKIFERTGVARLAPVLKTIFHQCVISYTYSQSNFDGSVLKKSHQS